MTRTIALFAALTLTALAVAGSATTSATSPPSADKFAIDMAPYLAPANTATSVSTIIPCAIIYQNGILDADEDAVDAKDLDIVTAYGGIPAANPIKAYGYTLHYPQYFVEVTSQTPMLIDSPGSGPVNNSDALPDTDGAFIASVSDPSGPAESGPGVLDRLRIESTGSAPPGLYPLSISNASHTDTSDITHVPDAIQNALIILDTVSGCGMTDMEMMNHSVSFASEIAANFPRTISFNGELYNHGPIVSGTTTDAETTLTLAGDCTANGESSPVVITSTVPMPFLGTSEPFEQGADIVCATGGPASITVESCSSLQPLQVDIYTPNDCATEVVNFNVDAGDTDGDGFSDEDEVGTPLCGNAVNDDDHDDAIVNDGCLGGPPQAGAFSEAQFQIGTNWLVACTPGGSTDVWPADLVIGSIPNSTNIVNIADLAGFVAPVRRLGTSPGDLNFHERYDISPGRGGPANWINVIDLVALVTLKPPVQPFAGTRAFNGPAAC